MSLLLKEYYELKSDETTLNEQRKANSEGKPVVVKGVIQRANRKNQNGRIYPYDVLRKQCDYYMENLVKKNIALGELDHDNQPVIQLKNVSHKINNLWWDGDDVLGEVQLLPTPAGKIALEMVLAGVPLGISSRAVGSVVKSEAQGADVVGNDLNIVCWDLVCQPSTHEAFLKLTEAVEIGNFNPNKVIPVEFRLKNNLEELLKRK